MNNTLRLTITVISFCMFFVSCKKDKVNNPNMTDYETDLQQFEAVWNGINTAYALWPIDTTDWDAVYLHYHPVFEKMDGQSDGVWMATWEELTSTLIDHHTKIYMERPSTKCRAEFRPGWDEVRSRDYYHINESPSFHYNMLNTLVSDGRLSDVKEDTGDNAVFFSGVLDEDIAYYYISSFNNCHLDTMKSFIHFKHIIGNDNIKAAIIDVRDNTGGIATNINYVVSCFLNETETIGYTQTKTGLGRYEFGPKHPYMAGAGGYINGTLLEGQNRNIPVVALTNLWSASAAEGTTIAIKNLPQGYVVGERTFGATCALNDDFDLFYSGSFGDSQMDQTVLGPIWKGHGHYVYTPKYLFTGVDGTVYEGHGIDPDLECLFDKKAWHNGVDNQLECAISFAKDKIAENENQ